MCKRFALHVNESFENALDITEHPVSHFVADVLPHMSHYSSSDFVVRRPEGLLTLFCLPENTDVSAMTIIL